jgi:hypothetical protein
MFTHHLPEEAMPWIAEARNVFDEMVIFIDEKRATPGTVDRAKKVASRVLPNKAETWYGADGRALVAACRGDWLFTLDYDEELGPEWQRDGWRQILETTQFTHFWFPRRWVVSKDRYIISNPWCPDFQLRLIRNHVEGMAFPRELHDSQIVPGPGACFQNLTVNHHVLWLCSRASREEKVRLYEELRPGRGSGHYYLYEDHAPREANLPAPVELDPKREILPMARLSPEKITEVSLEVKSVPGTAGVSELFWVDVAVTNATSETLHSRPPSWPVHLSYHWLDQATRRMCVWDGYRNGFYPDAPANTTTFCTMMIIAPDHPGDYLLQISMVQEEVGWFDQVRPDTLREFALLVTA